MKVCHAAAMSPRSRAVPDLDQFCDHVASRHHAPRATLIFFDHELAIQSAEHDQRSSRRFEHRRDFRRGRRRFHLRIADVLVIRGQYARATPGGIATCVISGASCTITGMLSPPADGAEVVHQSIAVGFQKVRRQHHQHVGAEILHLPAQLDGGVACRCGRWMQPAARGRSHAADRLHQRDAFFSCERIAFTRVPEQTQGHARPAPADDRRDGAGWRCRVEPSSLNVVSRIG